jgi:hypothetical protein
VRKSATTTLVIVVIALAIAAVAAVLLALGTFLARFFPVSAWEATLVIMGVTVGALWLLSRLMPPEPLLLEETDDEPAVYLTDLPLPPLRGRRKRRR